MSLILGIYFKMEIWVVVGILGEIDIKIVMMIFVIVLVKFNIINNWIFFFFEKGFSFNGGIERLV